VHARRTFAASPQAVREARRVVMAVLIEAACTPETIETARLLVSELVTNVIKHAHSDTLSVEVIVFGLTFRVAVHDADPRVPQRRAAAVEDEQGRGLALVDALAERWDTEKCHDPHGKVTWFEMTCT
jgi:serine/threonine-protein kinase RsbW